MKIISNGKTLEIPSCALRDIYSTEEQVIGRWIDGKPLYRKVYTGRATFSTTSTITVIEKDFRSTKSVKRMSGIITAKYNFNTGYTYTYAMPTSACTTKLDRYINLFISGSGDLSVDIVWDTKTVEPAPFELVVEYTKTTDQATIELPAGIKTEEV